MNIIEHRVRERAYYIWEGEGRVSGRAHDHWIRAEAEMAAMDVETASETAAVRPVAEAVAPKAKPAKARTSASTKAAAPKASMKKVSRKGQVEGVALH